MPESRARVLLVHNYYQQPGGEDEVFRGEGAMLEARGHAVWSYTRRNDDLESIGAVTRARLTMWNQATYRELRTLLRQVRPDVMHVHNTLPLVSPAAYYAARAEGVAVVQTLHNYRLICPSATLYRDGRPCEDCVGKAMPWPGVVHACYRDSWAASAGVAALLAVHRAAGTWKRAIDAYIALTEGMREILVAGGLPADRVCVKPNFVNHDPGVGERRGGYMLFVGRLTEVKGVQTLLDAWRLLDSPIPLKVVGDGSLRSAVTAAARSQQNIEWLGQQERDRVQQLMRDAYALIFPSVWYEPFSLVVLEALAAGVPVIGSNLGSVASVVQHEQTGLHFAAGEPQSLADAAMHAWRMPEAMALMARRAREEYAAKYTPETNYQMLIDIYAKAVAHSRRGV
ncbi:MAG TPA: glycosyltransferase [Chloroflexota bacterium]|nr:glycosyltransferase [Chloroflexota bacterium]